MLPFDNLTDGDLMTRTGAGDQAAFEALYHRHKGVVFGLLLHMLRDRGVAEDVMLDVFTRVWQQAASYRAGRASVKTWLVAITRHAAIDSLRRRQVRPDQHDSRWADDALAAMPAENDVEGEVGARELRHQVQQALQALPADLQQVLALAYLEGCSHAEIARRLDQPLGTVKGRIRTAMLRLREQFPQ